MTRVSDTFDHLCASNPVSVLRSPDWERIVDHVGHGLVEDHDRGLERVDRRHTWLRRRPGRPHPRTVIAASAICAAAAGGLLAVAPWSSSPGFLARAAAALTPEPGTVLFESWEETRPAVHANAFSRPGLTAGPDQLWVQGGPPYRYRAILQPHINPNSGLAVSSPVPISPLRELVGTYLSGLYAGGSSGGDLMGRVMGALGGKAMELGGTLDSLRQPGRHSEHSLVYVPSNEIWSMHFTFAFGVYLPGKPGGTIPLISDPLSALRAALAEGRAHEAGTTQLEGRTVLRIDFDSHPLEPPADAPPSPANAPTFHPPYAYVEPETFRPVEIVIGEGVTYRFLAYEYLPATAANLALTSVQAQHPTATIVHEKPAHEGPSGASPAVGEVGSASESSSGSPTTPSTTSTTTSSTTSPTSTTISP